MNYSQRNLNHMMMTLFKLQPVIFFSLILGISFLTQPSDGAIYYVTPVEPNDECPVEFPCHALNYFANKSRHIFENETEVSLLFLDGSHYMTEPLCVDGLEKFEMTANSYKSAAEESKSKVLVHLLCGTENSTHICQWLVKIAVCMVHIQNLEIYGKGEVLIFSGAKTVLNNLVFQDSGLMIQSYQGLLSPSITVSSTLFYRTRLAVLSQTRFGHSTLTVENVQFLQEPARSGGLLMICGTGFYIIVIRHITVDKTDSKSASFVPGVSEEATLPAAVIIICGNYMVDSDIYISPYVDEANVTVEIDNATLIRGHKTGIHFSILPFYVRELSISVSVRNCTISGYTHGALVWNSSLFEIPGLQYCSEGIVDVTPNTAKLIIEHTIITNNTQSASTPIVKAAGLSMNSNRQSTLSLSNSLFQRNKDITELENVIWINKVENISISNCHFIDNVGRAISAHGTKLYASENVSFVGNSVYYGSGGALHLESSSIELADHTMVNFVGNFALLGGAIFVYDPLGIFYLANNPNTFIDCFLQYQGESAHVNLVNNRAKDGGNQIYGAALKSNCIIKKQDLVRSISTYKEVFTFHPRLNSSSSEISSVPTRVCICDAEGYPQCSNLSKIFVTNVTVIPGELFNILAVLVGADFGTTRGTIFTYLLETEDSALDQQFQVQNIVNVNNCTKLHYRIKSNLSNLTLYMHSSNTRIRWYGNEEKLNSSINDYFISGFPPIDLQTTPIYITVTLKDCPPGFRLKGTPPSCECYTRVKELHVTCNTESGTGYISRTGTVWISSYHGDNSSDERKGVMYNKNCPPDYCQSTRINVDIGGDPDSQCAVNRAGRLCGGCKENYSLAIGSSNCILCPNNNNNLALLIFFAAAGLLLVILIGALNLTVTAGMINGIIFYANIVWTNKTLLFPPESNGGIRFLKTFIAWINLDFGIETCFFQGMDAYTKTWLQFLFPFYIWFISGAIVVCCHYSTRMTKIFGNRAVSILATLLCLSYLKLMRTILDGLALAVMSVYDAEDTSTGTVLVWSLDGNLHYGHSPHIFLLLAVLAALLILWAPYTAALLFTQWLRKVSEWKIFRWVVIMKPYLDSHYGSLKDKHHYWYGVLLFVRGVHLVIFSLTYVNAPMINILLISLSAMLLLLYETSTRLYRKKSVRLFHGLCLLNLAVLGACVIYTNLIEGKKSVAIVLSVSVVFIQFCLLFIWNAVEAVRNLIRKMCPDRAPRRIEQPAVEGDPLVQHQGERENIEKVFYRDSILSSSVKDTY